MIAMTLAEIAAVVGGSAHGDPEVVVDAPATVDSRQVAAGGLFVAIAGEHVDGHEYAAAAIASGAAAVLGSRPTPAPTVVVDDPVSALGRLARHVVDRLTGTTVIALTGSQGKTGTKDYLAQVLAASAPTVATAGNHNNELGVPLTLLQATPETRYLVVEMGARGIGHIAYLCEVAPPTVAAVLNVGTAHVGEFGSREAIALAKGEIVEALPVGGVAVLNADDPFTREMGVRTDARVLTFGRDGDVGWRDETFDDLDRPSAVLTHAGVGLPVALRQVGAHQLANAAAAAALAVAAGLDFPTVVAALGEAVGQSRWRMELHERPDGVVVLNDSYNANPDSMRAAVDAVATIGKSRGARTLAVLGEMRELGAEAAQSHHDLGAYVADRQVDVLLVVGEPARALLDGATSVTGSATRGVFAADQAAALAWLRENVAPGDVVVVKASRAAELDRLADALVLAVVEENR